MRVESWAGSGSGKVPAYQPWYNYVNGKTGKASARTLILRHPSSVLVSPRVPVREDLCVLVLDVRPELTVRVGNDTTIFVGWHQGCIVDVPALNPGVDTVWVIDGARNDRR